jgi:hypothetical protein
MRSDGLRLNATTNVNSTGLATHPRQSPAAALHHLQKVEAVDRGRSAFAHHRTLLIAL